MPQFTISPENKFPVVPNMDFYETDKNSLYFSASDYIANSETKNSLSVEDFFTKFESLIETLCETTGIPRAELRVDDEKGNIFLEECLAIPFLIYAEPSFGPYLYLRMEELLRFGVTINDNVAKYFYESRFEPHRPATLQ
jgi:hypothetical protein